MPTRPTTPPPAYGSRVKPGTTNGTRRQSALFSQRLFGNLPVLAVEDRDVQRLQRRVVVGRVAVIDVIQKKRRVIAGQRGGVLQHIGAGEIVAAAAQDF